jgi:sodium transport system permease protein
MAGLQPQTTAPVAAGSPKRLNWGQVWILYRREMRAALREKTIVLNSLLIPVFLYPFLLWLTLSGLMFVMGQTQGLRSRIVVSQWPQEHPGLRHNLERDEELELVEAADPAAFRSAEQRLKDGRLDALVEFSPATEGRAALAGNFQARITYNQSKERSAEARDRVASLIEQYRADWLRRDARRRGLEGAAWQGFTLAFQNVASKKQMGAFLLGLIAPIIFVVTVAIGCFYPAVDALAGERERNTWETLMATAASRLSIVTAKYLYVASLGGLAGLLNLVAVMLTIRPLFAPLLARAGQIIDCTIPLAAFPVAMVAAALLAGFIAAGMMIFASFARTFKEGQAMITPFYMLILVPVVFLQVPGLKLTLPLALVPIVNVTLMVREALLGTFHWAQMGVTVAVSLALIALCLRLAAFILQFEDVVMGSYSGSLTRFFQARVFKRAKIRNLTAAEGNR